MKVWFDVCFNKRIGFLPNIKYILKWVFVSIKQSDSPFYFSYQCSILLDMLVPSQFCDFQKQRLIGKIRISYTYVVVTFCYLIHDIGQIQVFHSYFNGKVVT